MNKNFIIGDEFGVDFIKKVISDAILFKNDIIKIPKHDKSALFLFFNKSLRTRMSFMFAAQQMGMQTVCEDILNLYSFEMENVPMNSDKPEHIKDAARVMSRYADVIGIRNSCFIGGGKLPKNSSVEDVISDKFINIFAKYATSPVINMESDAYHPMQGLALIMSIFEKIPTTSGFESQFSEYNEFERKFDEFKTKKIVLTYAPHTKHLPIATPQSQLLAPAMMGSNVILTCPKGFELSDVCLEKVCKYASSFKIIHNQDEALQGADFVIAKSWLSIDNLTNGNLEESDIYYEKYKNWQLTESKMNLTNNALFSHCLPVRRDVEVTSSVLDSKNSMIIDEAENRMWVQMSLINSLFKS